MENCKATDESSVRQVRIEGRQLGWRQQSLVDNGPGRQGTKVSADRHQLFCPFAESEQARFKICRMAAWGQEALLNCRETPERLRANGGRIGWHLAPPQEAETAMSCQLGESVTGNVSLFRRQEDH